MKATRIEAVETVAWDRWLLLKVNCEDGTVGIGEAGVHGWLRPAETMVNVCEPYLVGKAWAGKTRPRLSTTSNTCNAALTSWAR